MELDMLSRLEAQEKKLDAIFRSVEKTRKYFLWTLIVTIVTVVVPILLLLLIAPWFLSTLLSSYTIQ